MERVELVPSITATAGAVLRVNIEGALRSTNTQRGQLVHC
jgi:hypothetical protein